MSSTTCETVRAEAPQRDAGGRYLKGNKGGPGSPYNRAVAAIKRELMAAYEEGDVAAIGRKLIEKAKEGDLAATRLLFQYTMPKDVEPDRVDVEEWKLVKENAAMQAELREVFGPPLAEMAGKPAPEPAEKEAAPTVDEVLESMTPAEIDELTTLTLGRGWRKRAAEGAAEG